MRLSRTLAALLWICSFSAYAENAAQLTEQSPDTLQTRNNGIITTWDTESKPTFPGGDEPLFQFIAENLSFPQEALDAGIHNAKVIVEFIVEKDGSIRDITVRRSPHQALSDEAVRIVELMPRWNPSICMGEPIPVRYNLPIRFRLE